MTQSLTADYLVIGTGAVSMAFVDTMLEESDATFIMVDRHHLPGGHWNDAYPFVRLHQPSAFYGVASTDLGSNRIDTEGSNKGYFELASGTEVSAYFEKLMRERFLPSGRVQYFPLHNYTGNHEFESMLGKEKYKVSVHKKMVDGTYYQTNVPSTHTPKFKVDDSVTCSPPNDLPKLATRFKTYTVLGGGKTAMDTCVWLLDHGVDPDRITWVCPRASWLLNRRYTQPGVEFFEDVMRGTIANFVAMSEAASVDELFEKLEEGGTMIRIDRSVKPEMYHYATISEGEVTQLRRISQVIRGDRVARLEPEQMVMQSGETYSAGPDTLYIDCTASAVEKEKFKIKPIFEDDRITLQPLFAPLVTYSAAVAGWVEANIDTDEEKNKLCMPVMLADTPADWMESTLGNFMNSTNWSMHKELNRWTRSCRLNPGYAASKEGAGKMPEHKELFGKVRQLAMPAVINTRRLIDALDAS